MDPQADLSLRWAHRPHCWFCHVAAQMIVSGSRTNTRNVEIVKTHATCKVLLFVHAAVMVHNFGGRGMGWGCKVVFFFMTAVEVICLLARCLLFAHSILKYSFHMGQCQCAFCLIVLSTLPPIGKN